MTCGLLHVSFTLQADELRLKAVLKEAEDLKKEQFKRSQKWVHQSRLHLTCCVSRTPLSAGLPLGWQAPGNAS